MWKDGKSSRGKHLRKLLDVSNIVSISADHIFHGAQRTKFLPDGENFVQFNDFEKRQEHPFCIYADFEKIKKEVKGENFVIDHDQNWDPVNSGTELKTNHQVSGFTFHTVSPYFPPNTVTYRNPDAG